MVELAHRSDPLRTHRPVYATLSPTGHVFRLFAQIGGILLSLWIADWKPGMRPDFGDLLDSRKE